MVGGHKNPPRNGQPSIKYRLNPDSRVSFELADFAHGGYAPNLSDDNRRQCSEKCEPNPPNVLSTSQLISVIGEMWDSASRPLGFFQPKTGSNPDGNISEKKEVILSIPDAEAKCRIPSPDGRNTNLCTDSVKASHFSSNLQPNVNFVTVAQRLSVSRHSSNTFNEFWKGKGLASVGISFDLGYLYGWMNGILYGGLDSPVKATKIESSKSDECGDTVCHTNTLTTESVEFEMDKKRNISLVSDFFLPTVRDIKADCGILRTSHSCLLEDYYLTPFLPSHNSEFDKYSTKTDGNNDLFERKSNHDKSIFEEECNAEGSSFIYEKPHFSLAKQEHAIAGALAGVFVSLCLHPVDTIKTVVQSCYPHQRSLCYIGKSIVSDRGLTGLYRGIATNLATSAPISAVYTFTYESVKAALLPLFPREYYSSAHCIAGGCASVATSFIFTPSERIKQHMQVSSHYHNCWNALAGIITKGGFRSLYAGWGAVLCRNVPHSIIKFYTYESLKELMLSSSQSKAQPSPLQTLVCGGLAGSTAALFTTPFDVVKTRLQTQIPGSISQYTSVIHALQEIGNTEGLKGLYRGLTPRLVMYMSQGAIFFASYEFFKTLFCLKEPQQQEVGIQC